MKKYLFFRTFALAIFLMSLIIMPFAFAIGFTIAAIAGAVSIIKNARTNLSFSARETFWGCFIGIVLIVYAIANMGNLLDSVLYNELGLTVCMGIGIIFASLSIFKKYIYHEEDCYIMDKKIHKLTKFYPALLVILSVVGVILKGVSLLAYDYVYKYMALINVGFWICNALFVVAIVQYIARMVHIYKCNK